MIALLYLGKLSLQTHTGISYVMKNKLPYCNLQLVFQTKFKLIIILNLKTKFLFSYLLALFIKLSVVAAMLFFYSKTTHHFKVRMSEHFGVSPLPGKMVKGDNNSVIKEHNLFYNHSSRFDNFSILSNSKLQSLP